jgi:RHS repeat-associated protein
MTPNRNRLAPILMPLLLLLASLHTASAYYDPGVQRWINRDPLGEAGFETMKDLTAGGWSTTGNPYLFVVNNPVALIDALGLDVNRPPDCAEGMKRTRAGYQGCIARWKWKLVGKGLCRVPIKVPVVGSQLCTFDDVCRGGRWETKRTYDCGKCSEGSGSGTGQGEY